MYGSARLFADDTNILYCGQDINTLVTQADTDMSQVAEWFVVNKLTLNVNKIKLYHYSF